MEINSYVIPQEKNQYSLEAILWDYPEPKLEANWFIPW